MKLLKIMLLFLLSITLLGCSYKAPAEYKSSYEMLLDTMRMHGMSATKKDETVILSIPNSSLFNRGSVNFAPQAYDALELILDFSNYYHTDEIAVIGYGATKSIMLERVHKISAYLWQAKIDTSFMYSYSNNDKDDCIKIKYSLI